MEWSDGHNVMFITSVLNVRQDSCVEALNNFSWEKVMVEMRDRSPDVLDVLATISK